MSKIKKKYKHEQNTTKSAHNLEGEVKRLDLYFKGDQG